MNIKEFVNDKNILSQYENDLRSLVEIPSVSGSTEGSYPFGRECARVLDKALEISKGYGFMTENHDYYCGSAILGESGTEIGIITHLDVVPAGTGWSYEPYTITADKGLYIGRGAADDKGPLLMGMYAMRYFRENNIALPFAVRLIMGCDEEVGSTDLEHFKTVRKPPVFSFTPDADYPVCVGEKGIMRIKLNLGKAEKAIEGLNAGTVSNAVAGQAVAVINGKEYRYEGITAHASTPEKGKNAISLMAKDLIEKGIVPESNKTAFEFIYKSAGEYLGSTLGIAFSDQNFGYLTCVASVLKIEGGNICQSFDIRYPTSRTFEELYSAIQSTITPHGFEIADSNKNSKIKEGYFKSPESREIKALTSACEEVLGYQCSPYTMGGGTYARSMPGAVAFGARIKEYADLLGDGRGKAHDRDEYIAIDEVKRGIEIMIKSLLNLGAAYSG